MTAHISEFKKTELTTIKKLMEKYDKIGIIDLSNLPSPQLQVMRKKLKDKLLIRTTKKRLIKIALESLKEKKHNLDKLIPYLDKCMPAIMFTNEDPFKIYNTITKNKSMALAKAGQIAPMDIKIMPGPTKFAPGPVIGELGQVGIRTAIENGKIAIKNELVIVKEGQEIKQKIADVLGRLDIRPIEIMLDLKVVYDSGLVYDKKILRMDESYYLSNVKTVHTYAINLAMKINYITKETTELLIKKAYNEANSILNKTK